MSLTRRDFARQSAITGAGVALASSVGALATAPNALASTDTDSAEESADATHAGVGYGPLIPDPLYGFAKVLFPPSCCENPGTSRTKLLATDRIKKASGPSAM